MEARLKRGDLYLLVGNNFDRQEFDLDLLPSGLNDRPPADAEKLEADIRAALATIPALVVMRDSSRDRDAPARQNEPGR